MQQCPCIAPAEPSLFDLTGGRNPVDQHQPLRVRPAPLDPDHTVRNRQEPSPAQFVDRQLPGRDRQVEDFGISNPAQHLARNPHLHGRPRVRAVPANGAAGPVEQGCAAGRVSPFETR